MDDYIVTVKYDKTSIFEKTNKYRVEAIDELDAKRKILRHPFYPSDGEIIKVKKAAYKKIKR